jgi:phytoene synthase
MPERSPAPPADVIPALAPAGAAVDLAACAALMRGGSKSFFAASLLLPARVRGHATALYAFCRVADDVIDGGGRDGAAVAWLHERLRRVYTGAPLEHGEDCALASVVSRFGIPSALLVALLEGFHWDAQGRTYETLEELHDYAARVAGTVGAMMAIVMDTRAPAALARACELGVAMQLTNIARDVGEDARNGRLYLPLQWLVEAGIDPDRFLANPDFDAALGAVVERLLRAADVLYLRSGAGIAQLPLACRPGMQAARLLYAEIGRQVERHGLDSVSRRAVVPRSRKAWRLAGAMVAALLPESPDPVPALEETRFLVEAVASFALPSRERGRLVPSEMAWWNLGERIAWVIELFEELERRDEMARSEGSS